MEWARGARGGIEYEMREAAGRLRGGSSGIKASANFPNPNFVFSYFFQIKFPIESSGIKASADFRNTNFAFLYFFQIKFPIESSGIKASADFPNPNSFALPVFILPKVRNPRKNFLY